MTSLTGFIRQYPNDEAARAWFEATRWPEGRFCPHCGNTETGETPKRKPMPYWCGACKSYFSVRTGLPLAKSKAGYQNWLLAMFLFNTRPRSTSSTLLARDLGVTQKTAWHMLHRIRAGLREGQDADVHRAGRGG